MAGTRAGSLDGKVAIVTGAGRGLGRAMTLGLLDAGARVAAVELDAPAIDETQDAVEDRGARERFLGIGADVTHDESGAKILRATTERFGRLDILINNAGISTGLLRGEDKPVGKLWETTPEEFRRVIDVNVVAPFLMMRAVLPTLLAQRWGRIINVTETVVPFGSSTISSFISHCKGISPPPLFSIISNSHRAGARTRPQRRHRQCIGARRRRRHAARSAGDGARSLATHPP